MAATRTEEEDDDDENTTYVAAEIWLAYYLMTLDKVPDYWTC
jgi:hypothetical protein